MATTTPFSPTSHHQPRSKSLPSKPHPLILQCNQHLASLESLDEINNSSLFSRKLTELQALHDCVENLVLLPLTQQVLVHARQEKWTDELLEGSLRLLDVCSVAKDSLIHTKECARELQSIMRRKRGGEMEVTSEVRKFLASRKVVKKAILKALENLKSNVKKGPAQSKPSNYWSLVSKLMMQNKKVSSTQESDINEFTNVDAALQSFVFNVTRKSDNVNHLQNQLENLESVVQVFVEALEALFKRFIKIRVSLLNILNH
ncbi:hypothetical protein P8452_32235 [Trifolium repens]|nr:hypothetical protein P8452_32235 [Trifolium repens]